VQVGRTRFSRCCHLIIDLFFVCSDQRWATRLSQTRTRIMNQLKGVALNEGLRRKKALWRVAGRMQLESTSLGIEFSSSVG